MREFLTEPAFDPAKLEREKNVVLNEMNDDSDRLDRGLSLKLYSEMRKNSQYKSTIIGTQESVRSITSEDLRLFMKQNYDAGQMTLYVAGPLDSFEAKETLESTLGALPNIGANIKPSYRMSFQQTDFRLKRPELSQNYAFFIFTAPSYKSLSEQAIHYAACDAIDKTLSDNIRNKYGCFYGIDFADWDYDKNTQSFVIKTSSSPNTSELTCIGLMEYYNDIDKIIYDDMLKVMFDSIIHGISNTNFMDASLLGRVKSQYEDCGVLYDHDEQIRVYQTVDPEDVRNRAKEILGGLVAMGVWGAEPDAFMTLEVMQKGMGGLHQKDITKEQNLTSAWSAPAIQQP